MGISGGNISISVHLAVRKNRRLQVILSGAFMSDLRQLIWRDENKINLLAIKENFIQQKCCEKNLRKLFIFFKAVSSRKIMRKHFFIFSSFLFLFFK